MSAAASVSWLRLQAELLIPGWDEIRQHTPLLAPVLLYWSFSLLTAVAMQPLVRESLMGEFGEVPQGAMVLFGALALLSPVIVLMKAAVLGLAMWCVLTLVGHQVRGKPLVSIALYGEAILAFHGVITALFLLARDAAPGPTLNPASPLDLLFYLPDPGPLIAAVGPMVTMMHIAWCLFLGAALVRVIRVGRGTAGLVSAGVWLGVALLSGAWAGGA